MSWIGGMAALAALTISSIVTTAAPAQTGAALAQPSVEERLQTAAAENRYRLDFDGQVFSGPAWDMLLAEGRAAKFFLLGEEHGVAENPKLAAALFAALAPDGYSKVAVEVSAPMAEQLDRAITEDGIDGLRRLYARPGGEPAFFGMKEEAEWLVAARDAAPKGKPFLWGTDYEVGGDRLLIAVLEGKRKPAAAAAALSALRDASAASWAKYDETRNPQFIYSFAGDPELVRAVRGAWPRRDEEASAILDTLEETFEINRLWVERKGYESNVRRSAFMRANFVRRWLAEKEAGRSPKVFMKFGGSHLVRGRNSTETFDMGALVPEIAAMEGGGTFHLLVIPGAGAERAVFNPVDWKYAPSPEPSDYAAGLAPVVAGAFPDAFTLIDLRPLRPILGRQRPGTDPELMRTVHGFDAILVMSGSTASVNLR